MLLSHFYFPVVTTPFLYICLSVFVTTQLLVYWNVSCISRLFKKYRCTLLIYGGQENVFLSEVQMSNAVRGMLNVDNSRILLFRNHNLS